MKKINVLRDATFRPKVKVPFKAFVSKKNVNPPPVA